jgi:hypothetical protein
VSTRAQQAGLRVEDVARPSRRKRARLYRLDAQVRAALKPSNAIWAKKTRARRRRHRLFPRARAV